MHDFIELPEIKAWLGIDAGNSDHDSVLTILRNAAWQTVKGETDREFSEEAEVTENVKGTGSTKIVLLETPTDVSEIKILETTLSFGDTSFELPEASYTIDGRIIERIDGGIFPRRDQRHPNILVTYTHGYTEETLPGDIRLLVLDLIRLRHVRKQNKTDSAIASKQVDDLRIQYRSPQPGETDIDLISDGRATINRYRRRRF